MTRAQSFKIFLKHFSKEDLPITLSDDNVGYFDRKNQPLGSDVIRQFLLQGEKIEEDDEDLTEYIACNIIPDTKEFYAVVYWRGKLLEYDYILATYNKNGVIISKKVIAGVRSDGQSVKRSVATIDKDWIVHIVVGEHGDQQELYDPTQSQSMTMELMGNGEIIFGLQDEELI